MFIFLLAFTSMQTMRHFQRQNNITLYISMSSSLPFLDYLYSNLRISSRTSIHIFLGRPRGLFSWGFHFKLVSNIIILSSLNYNYYSFYRLMKLVTGVKSTLSYSTLLYLFVNYLLFYHKQGHRFFLIFCSWT